MAHEQQEVAMGEPTALLTDLSRSGRDLLGTLLSMLQNRIELIGLELQEEKQRIASLLIWTGLAVLFLLLAIILGTFAVIYLLDGTSRTIALIAFTALYVLGALAALAMIRRRVRQVLPFAQTLAELKKDRECF
jgi:uncharacterized membrane protein YqjE